ncbi:hypothetical protein AAGS61_04215 [Lysinibacillus sp. KU-BSD001]
MKEIKCSQCSKLLLKAKKDHEVSHHDYDLEVKCKHCKAINRYKAK